jgi:hypothetical protein
VGKPSKNSYADAIAEYGDVTEISLFVTPLQNDFEAQYYGVDRVATKKVIMSVEEAALFNKFTRIWVDVEPNEAKNNNDYYVSTLPTSGLNISTMTITKVAAR